MPPNPGSSTAAAEGWVETREHSQEGGRQPATGTQRGTVSAGKHRPRPTGRPTSTRAVNAAAGLNGKFLDNCRKFAYAYALAVAIALHENIPRRMTPTVEPIRHEIARQGIRDVRPDTSQLRGKLAGGMLPFSEFALCWVRVHRSISGSLPVTKFLRSK